MSRTFAMRVYAAAYGVLCLAFGYIFFAVLLPGASADPNLSGFIPILGGFLALFVVVLVLALAWPSAPRRPWFWILGLLPAVLFVLMNAPYLPYSMTHPSDDAYAATLPLVLWTIVAVVAGYAAYREARARRAAPAADGAAVDPSDRRAGTRAVWAVAISVGVTLGIAYSGVLAKGGGGGGSSVAAAPTQTDTLVAEGTKYLTTSYTVKSGGVLGLFVENHDGSAHSFDIDALNVHVNVPANATVALTVKPTGAGTLAFYCSIPGHREAGMAGTIAVQ